VIDMSAARRVRLRRPATVPAAGPAPGPAAGTATRRVLLLHGLGGSTAAWTGFAACADPALELWEAELPWGAFSDPTWSRQPDLPAIVRAAVDAVPLGVDVIVAHSFAADLVLEQIIAGDLVAPSALVLISPFYRADADDFGWDTIEAYLHGLLGILDEGLKVSAFADLDPEIRTAMASRVRDRIGPYGWMRFFDAYLRTPMLDLSRADLPVLVIGGIDDVAAAPSDAVAVAKGLPDARLELLADCGHFPMIQRPELTATLVGRFLAAESLLKPDPPQESP
jgi:pimeloyl-ACP methyl ester carboxylesterase